MAAKKTSDGGKEKPRVVWQEFGNGNGAMQRPKTPNLPPAEQSLRVQATRKGKGGKTVTVVSGFQTNPENLAQVLKKLKAQCGTGGTVKEDTLEIQGDHRQKLMELLIQMGYPTKISGG